MKAHSLAARLMALALIGCFTPVDAQVTQVRGKVVATEGNITPSCRRMYLRQDNGNVLTFRIPDQNGENTISSIAITALTSGLYVDVSYSPTATTGCGSEPEVLFIQLRGPSAP